MPVNNISSNQSSLDKEYNLELIAHRGYDVNAPENSISAFDEASKEGYSTVELDVNWTEDNIPVILHDDTINRTARKENGDWLIMPRNCSDYTYEELLNFDFGIKKGEEYRGEKIPTLYEAIDCSLDKNFDLYIELKDTDNFDDTKAQIIADAIKEAGIEDSVTLISFEKDYLQKMSELLPNARLGLLSEKKITDKTISALDELKTDDNEVFLDIKASKVNEKGSELLEENGYTFEAWTVDNIKTAKKMYEYGATGITTDKLLDDEVYQYLNEAYEK